VRLEWDESKDDANRKKHGVSFEEAGALFTGGHEYLEIFDDAHSDEEDRFIAIGPLPRGVVLVIYTERDGDTIRIISARWATKREADQYREYTRRRAR
jgi:uncharacterized DUF497 family protein